MAEIKKVVLDVNVWISALLWGGLPSKFLHLSRQKKIIIFVSEPLLSELEITLKRDKFQSQLNKRNYTVDDLMTITKGFSEQCSTIFINVPKLRDIKDNKIIATALTAKSKNLITGDRDLLILNEYKGILIQNPTDFLSTYFPDYFNQKS